MTDISIYDEQSGVLSRCTKRVIRYAKHKYSKILKRSNASHGSPGESAREPANANRPAALLKNQITSVSQTRLEGSTHLSDEKLVPERKNLAQREQSGIEIPTIVLQSPFRHENEPIPQQQPSEKDRRFMGLSEYLPGKPASSDSSRCLIASVCDDDQNSDQRQQEDRSMTLLDESIKRDGAFRVIHVRFDNDPDGSKAPAMCIMHDTGSAVSLTFECKLRDLGMKFEPQEHDGILVSVTGDEFSPVGRRQICFSYRNKPEKLHWVDVLVLKDPPVELEPSFDFLFGRDLIRKAKVLTWNKDVIGHIRAVTEGDPLLSIRGEHLVVRPRASFATSQSESESAHATKR